MSKRITHEEAVRRMRKLAKGRAFRCDYQHFEYSGGANAEITWYLWRNKPSVSGSGKTFTEALKNLKAEERRTLI